MKLRLWHRLSLHSPRSRLRPVLAMFFVQQSTFRQDFLEYSDRLIITRMHAVAKENRRALRRSGQLGIRGAAPASVQRFSRWRRWPRDDSDVEPGTERGPAAGRGLRATMPKAIRRSATDPAAREMPSKGGPERGREKDLDPPQATGRASNSSARMVSMSSAIPLCPQMAWLFPWCPNGQRIGDLVFARTRPFQ